MTELYHFDQLPLFGLPKECTSCHTEKFLDDFPIARGKKDGHKSRCKICTKAQEAAAYRAHPERYIARSRRYKANNPEKVKQMRHDHHEAHREHDKQVGSAWQQANPDKVAAIHQRWCESHPEHQKQWQQANPEKSLAATHRYLARKKNVTIEEVDFRRILERDGPICHICGQPIDITIKHTHRRLHFDHVIPLSRGGPHCEENLKPSHAVCNVRKHTRLLSEMTSHQRRGPG